MSKEIIKEDIITKLMNKELSINEFMNLDEINSLLIPFEMNEFLKEAEYRALKWIRKRKLSVSLEEEKEIKERVKFSQFFKLCLDKLVKKIIDNSGEQIINYLEYMIFAYSIGKILKNSNMPSWKKRIEQHIKKWLITHNSNEKVLKAIALITAKLTYKFYYSK